MMIAIWLLVGVLFVLTHAVSLYLTGKAMVALEAQREAYKKIAYLAIDEGKKIQGILDEVLDAVFEATKAGPAKPKSKKLDKGWD